MNKGEYPPKNVNEQQELLLANTGQENTEEYIAYVAEKTFQGQALNEAEQAVLDNDANKQKMLKALDKITGASIEEKIAETEEKVEKSEREEYLQPLEFDTSNNRNTQWQEDEISPEIILDVHSTEETSSEKESDASKADKTRGEILAALLKDKEVHSIDDLTPEEKKNLKEKQEQRKADKGRYGPINADNLISNIKEYTKDELQNRDANIESKRKDFIEEYDKAIKEVSPWKKTRFKVANWLGLSNKDAFIEETEAEEKKDAYENAKYIRESIIRDRFHRERTRDINDRATEKKWSQEDLYAFNDRYYRIVRRSENIKDLNFIKEENQLLRQAKQETWEENKSKAEKLLQKSGEYLEQNKILKNTVGNKWFRFALTTGTIGLATGGFSSLFLINRAARFGGGILGGRIGKFVGDKFLNHEKILLKKSTQLDEWYKKGEISANEYDNEREKIDLILNRYALLRQTMTLTGALYGGAAAGGLANYAETHSNVINPHEKQPIVDDNKDTAPKDNTETETEKKQEGNTTEKPKVETTPGDNTSTTPDETKTDTIVDNTPEQSGVEKDWVIKKGEGIENSLIRQIEHNPDMAKELGWNGTEDLHKFAQGEAHRIALSEGYVDPKTGAERWVYNADTQEIAYELHKEADGTFTVREHIDGKLNDLTDQANDKFETDSDRLAAKPIYEKTHGGYVEHHDTVPLVKTEAIYTGDDEVAIEESPVIEGTAPEGEVLPGAAPQGEVLPGNAPQGEVLPQDARLPNPSLGQAGGGYQPEMPRTYGGGPEESGYGFPGPGRAVTGGGNSVELPKTYGGVNGGGGIFEDILRMILGGR